MQTSFSKVPCPTNRDCKPNNSDGHTCPDAASGVQLNDQYLDGQPMIAEGSANQGGQEQCRCQVRVNCDRPDLPVVAM